MMKRLNNKGYMLVEIILAFAIAMGVMYFLMELTIRLKNKNDDLLVKTLVATDQAIIYNAIMKDLYTASETAGINIDCNYVKGNFSDLDVTDHIFEYNGFKNIVSEYVTVGAFSCSNLASGGINVKIPLKVKQLPDENFDVNIKFYVS